VGERGFLPLRQRAASLPLPSGLILQKTAMLGVEIRDQNPPDDKILLSSNLLKLNQKIRHARRERASSAMDGLS
ncbi:hypothetical protein, partial [Methylomonas methanica]|uniref:hypothetical protein n=1 Tax=Methylomonas methanica TaxID=421 RepID=UPI000AE741F3